MCCVCCVRVRVHFVLILLPVVSSCMRHHHLRCRSPVSALDVVEQFCRSGSSQREGARVWEWLSPSLRAGERGHQSVLELQHQNELIATEQCEHLYSIYLLPSFLVAFVHELRAAAAHFHCLAFCVGAGFCGQVLCDGPVGASRSANARD